jgi:hypothetical protein
MDCDIGLTLARSQDNEKQTKRVVLVQNRDHHHVIEMQQLLLSII